MKTETFKKATDLANELAKSKGKLIAVEAWINALETGNTSALYNGSLVPGCQFNVKPSEFESKVMVLYSVDGDRFKLFLNLEKAHVQKEVRKLEAEFDKLQDKPEQKTRAKAKA